MRLILADINEQLIQAWQPYFNEVDDVTLYHGSIFDKSANAIVSPANSFGFMDGGIDLLLSEYLGWHVQERLQARIKQVHHGELLVGQADIVATDHEDFPYLIAAPTMRVPQVLGRDTMNPYLAMRAVLLLVKYGTFDDGTPIRERVQTIAVSGLGTGVGKVPPKICAAQMHHAIAHYLWDDEAYSVRWLG